MPDKKNLKFHEVITESVKDADFDWKDYKVALLVTATVVMGVFVGLIPQVKDIFAIRSEIASKLKELDTLDQKYSTLNAYGDAELNSMVNLVEGALPSDKPIFQALATVQAMAIEQGLQVSGFDFSPGSVASSSAGPNGVQTQSKGGIQKMDVQVSLVGTFENLLGFVSAVERSIPLSEVEGFSVSSAASFSDEIKTTMKLKIFYMYPPSTISKISSPIKPLTVDQIDVIDRLNDFVKTSAGLDLPPVGVNLRDNPFTY